MTELMMAIKGNRVVHRFFRTEYDGIAWPAGCGGEALASASWWVRETQTGAVAGRAEDRLFLLVTTADPHTGHAVRNLYQCKPTGLAESGFGPLGVGQVEFSYVTGGPALAHEDRPRVAGKITRSKSA